MNLSISFFSFCFYLFFFSFEWKDCSERLAEENSDNKANEGGCHRKAAGFAVQGQEKFRSWMHATRITVSPIDAISTDSICEEKEHFEGVEGRQDLIDFFSFFIFFLKQHHPIRRHSVHYLPSSSLLLSHSCVFMY